MPAGVIHFMLNFLLIFCGNPGGGGRYGLAFFLVRLNLPYPGPLLCSVLAVTRPLSPVFPPDIDKYSTIYTNSPLT